MTSSLILFLKYINFAFLVAFYKEFTLVSTFDKIPWQYEQRNSSDTLLDRNRKETNEMASINVRVSSELEGKMLAIQNKIAEKLPRGAEITMSSLVRGAMEKLIEEFEAEQDLVIITKTPLLKASKDELNCLRELKVNEKLRVLEEGLKDEDFKSRERLSSKIKEDLDSIDLALRHFEENDSVQ